MSDTGAGIPPEVAGHIFEPFFTTKPKGQGTGLGLATVYGIVTEAGGSLSMNSEAAAGIGTTIRLLFPAVDEPAAPAAIAPAARHRGTWRDDPGRRGRGRHDGGYRSHPAPPRLHRRRSHHRSRGNRLAAQPDVRLLLTDSVMPQMSGRELARQIRELRPELPVLFMSGYDQGVTGTRRVLREDVALVQKPFNAETLLTRVRSVMPRASV